MKKKVSKRLVIYEIRNIAGNPFIPFFGVIFPLLLLVLITKAAASETPQSLIPEVNTAIFISMSMIIPMAIMLIGYGATYSQELEKGVPLRMKLFGFAENTILKARIIAQILVLTAGLLIYTAGAYAVLDIQIPKFTSALCLIACVYILGVIFIVLVHGIANLVGKFGPTYAITMGLYFAFMMLGGMMGIKTEQFPEALQTVANMLPVTYVSNDFITFWQGGSYNFMPLIQAYLLLGAVAGIVLFASQRKQR